MVVEMAVNLQFMAREGAFETMDDEDTDAMNVRFGECERLWICIAACTALQSREDWSRRRVMMSTNDDKMQRLETDYVEAPPVGNRLIIHARLCLCDI